MNNLQTVKVNRIIKDSMLGQGKSIACHTCDKPYCCRNQQSIQIATTEFHMKRILITKEQLARARHEIEVDKHMLGKSVYTCPFNNPDTGACEIYENRFIVCAGHGVVADDAEVCNTDVSSEGTFIVNPINTIKIALDKDNNGDVANFLGFHTTVGEPIDLLDAFRQIL